MQRITVTPLIKDLLTRVPIELGLTDAEVVGSIRLKTAQKTFSRYRVAPPNSIAGVYLIAIARLVHAHWRIDSADVLSAVRKGPGPSTVSLCDAIGAEIVKVPSKELLEVYRLTKTLATTARRICLFDRSDSFEYLRPEVDDEPSTDLTVAAPTVPSEQYWLDYNRVLRYDRAPRICVVLTGQSLENRARTLGDKAVEHLLGNHQAGHDTVTVINDALPIAHRVFKGIFADAAAVAIFDHVVALVRPTHGRTIRIYDARHCPCHARIIRGAIRAFARMRRFRVHPPTADGVVSLLEGYLSYRSCVRRALPSHFVRPPRGCA